MRMRKTDARVIAPDVAKRWINAAEIMNAGLGGAGFPPIVGTPPGYFLDVPEASREASRHADDIRKNLKGDDASVEYSIHFLNDQLVSTVSWSEA